MKLWLLTANNDCDYWYYDMNHALVIRAETEHDARRMAEEHAADEPKNAWIDSSCSDCQEIAVAGEADIILIDFHAG